MRVLILYPNQCINYFNVNKMKKLIYGSLFLAIVGIGIVGCKKENVNPVKNTSDGLVVSSYLKLENQINNDLNQMANGLRRKKADFNSSKAIIETAREVYSDDKEAFDLFLINFNKENNNKTYSIVIEDVIQEIDINMNNCINATSFISYLESKFNDVESSDFYSENDKNFILNYIIIYKSSISFLINNQDLFSPNNHLKAGWWDDWGKCAAGILGGAGGGALGGGAAGSVIPGVGTLAGGIIGGISGALTGAAAAC